MSQKRKTNRKKKVYHLRNENTSEFFLFLRSNIPKSLIVSKLIKMADHHYKLKYHARQYKSSLITDD